MGVLKVKDQNGDWLNAQGVNVGVPGPPGPTGPQGAASTVPGPTGPTGATGAQGPQGVKGDTGNTGAQGIQGIQGVQGPTGATGQAEVWFSGAGAPAGATGAVGDWYLDTTTGDVSEKTGASTWTVRSNIKGPTGSQGIQGIQGIQGVQGPTGQAEAWFSSAGAPAGGTGAVGDWHLNTTNGDVSEKTGASTWTVRGNIRGPQGIQGVPGGGAAIDITNVPAGNIAATTVQAALNELDAEKVKKSGDTMTGSLVLPANPTAALEAAPKQYIDQVMPIGIITMFGGAAAPVGGVWLPCDNTQYAVATYPELAAILGNAVGGNFRVPDLVNRFAVGSGATYASKATGGTADAVVVSHTHTIDHTHAAGTSGDDTPDHSHQVPVHGHGNTFGISADGHHAHSVGGDQFAIWSAGAPDFYLQFAGAGALPTRTTLSTDGAGSHGHGLTGGVSNQAAFNTTGVIDSRHKHSVPASSHSGSSGGATGGVAGTGQNVPPYCAVLYVIRAK
jgi:hypothetical protein